MGELRQLLPELAQLRKQLRGNKGPEQEVARQEDRCWEIVDRLAAVTDPSWGLVSLLEEAYDRDILPKSSLPKGAPHPVGGLLVCLSCLFTCRGSAHPDASAAEHAPSLDLRAHAVTLLSCYLCFCTTYLCGPHACPHRTSRRWRAHTPHCWRQTPRLRAGCATIRGRLDAAWAGPTLGKSHAQPLQESWPGQAPCLVGRGECVCSSTMPAVQGSCWDCGSRYAHPHALLVLVQRMWHHISCVTVWLPW